MSQGQSEGESGVDHRGLIESRYLNGRSEQYNTVTTSSWHPLLTVKWTPVAQSPLVARFV